MNKNLLSVTWTASIVKITERKEKKRKDRAGRSFDTRDIDVLLTSRR